MKKKQKIFRLSKMKIISFTYLIVMYAVIMLSSTYAYLDLTANNGSMTGQGGCFNVNYTGQNLTAASINTSEDYTEGAKATVTLSKNSSCKLYTEANIYIKTNTNTTAPITTTQALKYKIFNGNNQINEGIVNAKNDLLIATVPLTETSTTYTIYLYIDSSLSGGEYEGKTYSGYVHASATQTSTIEGHYLVTFNQNNGDTITLNKTVTKGQPYGWLPTPSKEGYTFDGWKLSSTNITNTTNVTQSANHTLTAQWSPSTYTVTLNPNGGSVSQTTMSVTYGSTYGTLPTPTYPGKTFKGWSILPEGYNQIEYLEATGTQYIDTELKPSTNMRIEGTVYTSTGSREMAIVGTSGGGGLEIGFSSTNNRFINWSTSSSCGINSTSTIYNTQLEFIAKLSDAAPYKELSLNINNAYQSLNQTYSTAFTSNNLTIFAYGSNHNYKYTGKLYKLKIYLNNNNTGNFIPCYDKATNKYGLYNLTKNVFYPNNATSGNDFSGGNTIYTTSSTTVTQDKNHTLTAVWE